MNLKKFNLKTPLILTLALSLVITGCSSAPNNDPVAKTPVTVELWHYYNGPQQTAFDQLVNEFNSTVGSEQGVFVESLSQGNLPSLIEKLRASAQKKVGAAALPDIFSAYADTAFEMDQFGLVAPLDSYITAEELGEYVPQYIDEGRFDATNSLKIFPMAKSTELFMLNKTDWDSFATATGASIDSLSTIEGVAATAMDYYEYSDGKAFFGRDSMSNYMLIGSRQLGVEIFSVENGKMTLNLDKNVMRKLWDNFYVPYISGYFTTFGRFRSDDIKTGDVIALVGSTAGSAYFPHKVVVDDVTYRDISMIALPAPRFKDSKPFAVQQGAGMCVTKSDPATELAAVTFLKWITEDEQNVRFSATSGYLPVKTSANNVALLEKTFSDPSITVEANLKSALIVGIEVCQTHEMYTNKAFTNGTAARDILETSMLSKAKADRLAINTLLDSGTSRADAIAYFSSDSNFESWFLTLEEDIRQSIG